MIVVKKKISYKITEAKSEDFNDEDLEHLVETNPDIFVYIWSPEMPISFRTLNEVKKIAEKENVLLKVYLYPNSSQELAEITVKNENYPREYLKKLNSFELSMQGIDAHQPVLFRFKKGKAYGMPLFGFKSVDEYAQYYQSMVSK